jgi:hypothetical protein
VNTPKLCDDIVVNASTDDRNNGITTVNANIMVPCSFDSIFASQSKKQDCHANTQNTNCIDLMFSFREASTFPNTTDLLQLDPAGYCVTYVVASFVPLVLYTK